MAKVEIYTQWGCPYCAYTEYDVTMDTKKRAEMVERAPGARTVPQIFIDDVSYGGCDDVHALDGAGKLDPILGL